MELKLNTKKESDTQHIAFQKRLLTYPSLSPAWADVLGNWLKQFNYYVLDYNNTPADENRLLEQLSLLIENCDSSITDIELSALLANEFEGLYWHCICYDHKEHWSSIKEPYLKFKARHLGDDVDQLILDTTHENSQVVKQWLLSQL